MKSITYSEKSWLLGDAAASAVLDYAVLLARTNSADSVVVNALDLKGKPHVLTLVIGPATMMTLATSEVAWDEPENDEATTVIHERMRIILSPPVALPWGSGMSEVSWEDLA